MCVCVCDRAEKTEVLNEDLQVLDKRVESIQKACSTMYKKMRECLVTAAVPDPEKKLVRNRALL